MVPFVIYRKKRDNMDDKKGTRVFNQKRSS